MMAQTNATSWLQKSSESFQYAAVSGAGFYLAWLISAGVFVFLGRGRGGSADRSYAQPAYGSTSHSGHVPERDEKDWAPLADDASAATSRSSRLILGGRGRGYHSTAAESMGLDSGRFGRFMICVELLDAIPEAAMIADTVVQGRVSWSFVAAIAALNVCNGLGTAMDLVSNNRETSGDEASKDTTRKGLFVCLFFAVGILCYTISADIYFHTVQDFLAPDNPLGSIHLVCLFGGTVLGMVHAHSEQTRHQTRLHTHTHTHSDTCGAPAGADCSASANRGVAVP